MVVITMTERTQRNEDYFRDLISVFEEHPEWEFVEYDQNLDRVVDDVVNTGTADLSYKHTETDGEFSLRLASFENGSSLEGNLSQSIDIDLPHDPNQDQLSGDLVEACRSIAEKQHNKYLSPVENTYDILYLSVPEDYDTDVLDDALTRAGDASREVENMYEDIFEAIARYK
jgi:hypothetical protein